jgi:hypothetical protein
MAVKKEPTKSVSGYIMEKGVKVAHLEVIYKKLMMRHTPYEYDLNSVLKLQLTFRTLTESIVENEKLNSDQKIEELMALLNTHMEVMTMYANIAGQNRIEALDVKQLSLSTIGRHYKRL